MGAVAKAHHIFDDATGGGTSAVIDTARFRNKRGIHFSRWVVKTGRFDLYLEGRPDSNAAWTQLLHVDESHHLIAPRTFASAVYHWPQIRYRWVATSGNPTLQVWYIE